MRCKIFFSCWFIFVGIAACNMSATNEPIMKDSVFTSDSNTAKVEGVIISADSLVVKIDSTILFRDTIIVDNAPNKNTEMVGPTLGIDVKGRTPDEVMRFAETLKGIPYVWASTDPKVGFDCSGFISYVFNNFGIKVPRSSVEFTNVGKTIPIKEAKRGDIILFSGTNPLERFVGHMGLIVSNTDTLRFIHSTSGKAKSVTVSPMNKGYIQRFVKTIRIFPQNDK